LGVTLTLSGEWLWWGLPDPTRVTEHHLIGVINSSRDTSQAQHKWKQFNLKSKGNSSASGKYTITNSVFSGTPVVSRHVNHTYRYLSIPDMVTLRSHESYSPKIHGANRKKCKGIWSLSVEPPVLPSDLF
jgi:hypothetical protein